MSRREQIEAAVACVIGATYDDARIETPETAEAVDAARAALLALVLPEGGEGAETTRDEMLKRAKGAVFGFGAEAHEDSGYPRSITVIEHVWSGPTHRAWRSACVAIRDCLDWSPPHPATSREPAKGAPDAT